MKMKRVRDLTLMLLAASLMYMCGDDETAVSQFQDDILLDVNNIDPNQFVADVTNQFFPLVPGEISVFEAEEPTGESVRVVSQVTNETKMIQGVATTVVHVQEFEDGELTEDTYDWYAQDINGNVWYFGEDTREIEDGEVVSTDGSFEAGVGGAKPGIIMLADPQPGLKYRNEFLPGVAEDQAEVISLNNTVTTSLDTYTGVLIIKETNPLEPGVEELDYYAPGIGSVLEDDGTTQEELTGMTEFLDQGLLDASDIDPDQFEDEIDNPYLNFVVGNIFTIEGENEDGDEVVVITEVLSDTKMILGVTCTIVRDTEYEDAELVEDTFDWYAQDVNGNVWYFGEDSKEYENGMVTSTEGSWEAGVDGAEAGIIMLANPQSGDKYRQEYYEDEAEDQGEVISIDETVTVAFGTFDNCVQIMDSTPLEPDALEYKYFSPDVGFLLAEDINSDSFEELVDVQN